VNSIRNSRTNDCIVAAAFILSLIASAPSNVLAEETPASTDTPAPSEALAPSETPAVSGTPAEEELEAELNRLSVTVSPIHLFLPVVELTTELRVHDKFSIAAVFGVGKLDVDTFSFTQGRSTESFSVFEIGTQVRAYPIGNFNHGMQVGAELLYVHVGYDTDVDTIDLKGEGIAVSPFLGYKVTSDGGFTFDVQGGYGYVKHRASGSNTSTGASAEEADSEGMVLLNINFGGSF